MCAARGPQEGGEEHVPATPETASLPMEEAGEEAARQHQQASQSQVTVPSGEEASSGAPHQNPLETLGELVTLKGKPGLTVRTRGSHMGPALAFPAQSSSASKDSSGSSTPVLSPQPSPPSRSPPVSPFVCTTCSPSLSAALAVPRPRGQSFPMDRLPSLQDGMGSCGASGLLTSYLAQRQPSLSDWVMHSAGGSGSLSSTSSGLFDRAGLPSHLSGESGGSPVPCVAPSLWLKAGWNFGAGGVAYRSPTVSDEVVSPGGQLLAQNPRARSHFAASARDAAADSPPALGSKGLCVPELLSTPAWSAPSTPRLPFSPDVASQGEESPGAVPGPAREVQAPPEPGGSSRLPGSPTDDNLLGRASLPGRQESSADMQMIAEALSSACINTLESRSPSTTAAGPLSPQRDRPPAPKRCRSPPSEKTSPATPGGAPDYMRAKSPRLELPSLVPPVGPGALSRNFAE